MCFAFLVTVKRQIVRRYNTGINPDSRNIKMEESVCFTIGIPFVCGIFLKERD